MISSPIPKHLLQFRYINDCSNIPAVAGTALAYRSPKQNQLLCQALVLTQNQAQILLWRGCQATSPLVLGGFSGSWGRTVMLRNWGMRIYSLQWHRLRDFASPCSPLPPCKPGLPSRSRKPSETKSVCTWHELRDAQRRAPRTVRRRARLAPPCPRAALRAATPLSAPAEGQVAAGKRY